MIHLKPRLGRAAPSSPPPIAPFLPSPFLYRDGCPQEAFYPMFEAYFWLFLIVGPYFQNTNGIGISNVAKNPNILVAHPLPNFAYIESINNGKIAANVLLKNVFAAIGLAPYF